MICVEARPLLDAYFDSELDLASSLIVEKHLSECAPCAETIRVIVQVGGLFCKSESQG